MTKNNKIKINKNLKRKRNINLRDDFQRDVKVLEQYLYSNKRKTTKSNFELIKTNLVQYKKLAKKMFRKAKKGENKRLYKRAERAFYVKKILPGLIKLRKLCNTLINLDKGNVNFSTLQASKRLVRIRRKRTYVKPYNVKGKPSWQRKKFRHVLMGSISYTKAIKRWTNLTEKEGKTFISKVSPIYGKGKRTISNKYHYVHYFQTTRKSVYARGELFEKRFNNLTLNRKQKKKYKKLKMLRQRLLSKFPRVSLKPAGKYKKAYSNLTTKKKWLKKKYVWLKYKAARKKRYRIDFLKTVLGTQFLIAHKASRNPLLRGRRYRVKLPHKALLGLQLYVINRSKWARKFQGDQKRAWLYNNLVMPKRLPYYFQKNSATKEYPYNKFQEHWKTRKRNPWLHSLISKRLLYSGFLASERRELKWIQKFSWIPFLRNKKPLYHKKNKLYFHRNRLLRDWNNRYVVRTNKKARIKQVLQKTTLPFYGHLRVKQFNRLQEKARIKKSTLLSREDIQLGYLERRLDVVVYRLNLAPNIFWARKLIQDGSIYVCSSSKSQTKDFEKLYAHYKHNAYPLKLRDPQNLYNKTPWNISFTKDFKKPIGSDFFIKDNSVIKRSENDQSYKWISTKLKFLLEPLRNINYLTSPGDVILCAPGALNNQYKFNKILWQKPVPKHLISYSNLTETKTRFKSRSNALSSESRKNNSTTNVGVVIFSPTFADLHKKDRMQRSFLRWMSL